MPFYYLFVERTIYFTIFIINMFPIIAYTCIQYLCCFDRFCLDFFPFNLNIVWQRIHKQAYTPPDSVAYDHLLYKDHCKYIVDPIPYPPLELCLPYLHRNTILFESYYCSVIFCKVDVLSQSSCLKISSKICQSTSTKIMQYCRTCPEKQKRMVNTK